MYLHARNTQFRQFLKQKTGVIDPEDAIDFEQLADVIEIFNFQKMSVMLKEHEKKSNLHKNHQRYLDYLGETAGFLPLAMLPENILTQLDDLKLAFPNFSMVIDFYREQFALSGLSGHGVFSANPLLIAGPPGIGKTAFCHALARIVGTPFELISMSGMTAGFVIGGMSSGWSDGKPGKVVEVLARGLFANPLINIDEIDKVAGDHRYDPLGPLYQLLEKETSAKFVDEALEVATNCSHIVWVATANDTQLIAEPILSRFTVIKVSRPTSAEMEKVLQSIYQKVRREHGWGSKFSAGLPPEVATLLIGSGLEPRVLQRELVRACGKAVLRAAMEKSPGHGGYVLSLGDFDIVKAEKHKSGVQQSIFPLASVLEEPEEAILFWSVREVGYGGTDERTQHLIGYIDQQGLGRVTSAIKAFDRENMRIQTRSGRVYWLKDSPGYNSDAEYVWAHWKTLNNAKDEVNVTGQYCFVH